MSVIQKNLFLAEPYRIFFPLGILFGIFGTGHWLAYVVGLTEGYSKMLHISVQMQTYMNCFVVGFLMTAFPRMSGSAPATKFEFYGLLFLTFGMFSFFMCDQIVLGQILYLGWLFIFTRFIVSRVLKKIKSKHNSKESKSGPPPVEFVWVFFAILNGLTGALLLILGSKGWVIGKLFAVGEKLIELGFILSVVIGVGGFLAPRLTGRFRSADPHASVCSPQQKQNAFKKKLLFHTSAGALFFASFFAEGFGFETVAHLVRAMIATAVFLMTGILPLPPKVKDFYAWLIWISFWCVVIGLWGVPLFLDYKKLWLHIMFIGGFSLMTYAVATMVVLSHSGQSQQLRKRLWILHLVWVCLTGALFFRLIAVFYPEQYFQLLGVSAVFWILAGFCWLGFSFTRMFKSIDPQEMEKAHEAEKQRIRNL